MPFYDYKCEICGEIEEEVFMSITQHDEPHYCEMCGAVMRTIIQPVPTVGPMPSKPLDLSTQTGRVFHSNAELREWQRETGKELVSADSLSWKRERERIREGAERSAKRAGYDDLEHRRRERKKEKKIRNSA